MRHEAAYERRASIWEDLGIGAAVAAMAGAVVIGIGLWYHLVTGAIFVVATAMLAWHSGFRPALVSAVIGIAAFARSASTCDRLLRAPLRPPSRCSPLLV